MFQNFRKLFDKLHHSTKGKPFLHTLVDGLDTFMFSPNTVTRGKGGVHIRDGMDLKRMMFTVVIALQLCLIFGAYNIGHQHYLALGVDASLIQKFLYGIFLFIPIFVVANVVGLGIEFYFASKKGHGIEEGFLVSGMLIPLIMPPDVPLWMVALATAFAVVVGKEAFGGTGMNIWNVALLSRVFVFFAYPTEISGDTCWVAYDYNIFHKIFGLDSLGGNLPDGFSAATPLALAAKQGWQAVTDHYSVSQMFWGDIPGSIGETSKVAILIGAALLIITGIASWKIMLSMVIGAAVTGLLFNGLAGTMAEPSPFLSVPFQYQFIMGSFLFAMAFMATDPVTAAQTETGKYIYGFLIGVVGMIVRVMNPAYPEGWMLAILLMNTFAPLIDHYVIQANINRRLKRSTHG